LVDVEALWCGADRVAARFAGCGGGVADLWTLKRCGVELTGLLQDSLTLPPPALPHPAGAGSNGRSWHIDLRHMGLAHDAGQVAAHGVGGIT
jgi:hypothetical protein